MNVELERPDGRAGRPRRAPWQLARLRRWLAVIVAAAAGSASGARPTPLQVLVPAVDGEAIAGAKAGAELTPLVVHAYLLARLPEWPGLLAVDERLAGDLLFEAAQGEVPDPETLRQQLEATRAAWGWDAAVLADSSDGRFVFRVLTGDGVREWQPPPKTGLAAIAGGCGRFLASCLELGPEAEAALGDPRLAGDDMFAATYRARRLPGSWEYNMGERRLDELGRFMNQTHRFPDLAAAVVDAGLAVKQDWPRTQRDIKHPAIISERLRLGVLSALGTAAEPEARVLCQNLVLETGLEPLLKPLAVHASTDAIDVLLEDDEPPPEAGITVDGPAALAGDRSPVRLAGAIRCLAVLGSADLPPLLPTLAGHEDPLIRRAAAFALASYPAEAVTEAARMARADADAETGFLARFAAWQADPAAADGLAAAARRWLDGRKACLVEDHELWDRAARALAALGEAQDEPRLRRIAAEGPPAARGQAVRGLVRLDLASPQDLTAWLRGGSVAVAQAALELLPPAKIEGDVRTAAIALAGSPHLPLAQTARGAVRRVRPADERAALEFDLATESLYQRLTQLSRLVGSTVPWRDEVLRQVALAHPCPQTRAQAVVCLAETAPSLAIEPLRRHLEEGGLWERLHAAAVAAKHAGRDEIGVLGGALERETDPVVRLYLQDALARLGAAPAPPPQRPARRFPADRIAFGECNLFDRTGVDSAYEYYYLLSLPPPDPADPGQRRDDRGFVGDYRKAAARGKFFFPRTNQTARNPLDVLYSLRWKDRWWTGMIEEFRDVDWLDGITVGEETMYFNYPRWSDGWRDFCLDAGLDPDRVEGREEALTQAERRAYDWWEDERIIDGFNRMYDFMHLYFGRLHPGFQVCTFTPSDNSPRPQGSNRRWKFDVVGEYFYGSLNHYRYNAIRRLRTIWPDRPVIWLVWPRVGTYPGDSWGHKGFRYDAPRLPESIFPPLDAPAYTQSVTAWLAGADPAFWAYFGFAHPDHRAKKGVGAVRLGELYAGNPTLVATVGNAYRGVADIYRLKEDLKELAPGDPGETDEADDLVAEILSDGKPDPHEERVRGEVARTIEGYAFEGKMVSDVARAMSRLPRPVPDREILWVGMEPLWDTAPWAQHISADHDCLRRFNTLAEIPLAGYRLIGLHVAADGLVLEAAMERLSEWLRDRPGVLIVHGRVPDDPEAKANTPDDLEPRLEHRWPWAGDVAWQDDRYVATGGAAATVSLGDLEGLLWQREGVAGRVLFVPPKTRPEAIQKELRRLHAEHGIGLAIGAGHGFLVRSMGGLQAISVIGSDSTPQQTKGFDLLTGIADPVVSGGAAIVTEHYVGPYVAVLNGVHVLCDQTIASAEPVEGGMRIVSPGLMQASGRGGAVTVRTAGDPLPQIADADFTTWLFGRAPGIARRVRPQDGGTVTFVRGAAGPVTFTSGP